ncbi:MAG: GNAT family N-acetyltransferase [Planctomycetes bacterium]|jgi:ribosomal protein S18 acetylase RimI-like enzyme|nr:GNAT family N-acetyltransferase [Planctomycetota bacterium]
MNEHAIIRKYRPEDREAVREISWNTADQGRTVDLYFHDHEAVADVLTRCYTDWEPQSLWVAEWDRAVVGYLTGCLDTRCCNRVMTRKVGPRAVAGAIRRGALWRAETWRLAAALIGTALLGGRPKVDLDRYPAHLHINLRPGFRGRGLGRRLIDQFRRQALELGAQGIHLVAWGENEGGRRFFEAMGFRLLRQQPLVLPDGWAFRRTSTVVYGWARED